MATAVATKASANGTSGDVTVTKPTSLAEGDLMIAFITSNTGGAGGETHAGPSGWTKLQNQVPTNGTILTVWGIIATSTETAATDFAWTSGGTNGETIGIIYRITGTNGFLSLAANVASNSGNSSDYPTASFTGLTTPAANSLLLMCGASETTGGSDINFTSYAVANNNPTWTEQDDLGNGGGARANMGVASADYAPLQATGNYSITMDFDGGDISGALVAITESINVAVTGDTGIINMVGNEGTPSAGASVSGTTGVINVIGNEGTTTLTGSKITNKDKNSASNIVNKDKT